MSQICDTIIHFRGDDASINDLLSKLHEGMSHEKLANVFGVSSNDDLRSSINTIVDAEHTIYQSGAWMPHVELWDAIIEKHYKNNISYVYRAEEPSGNIFVNTDTTGITFPEKYRLDYNIDNESDIIYFENVDSLINWCNTELGFNETTIDGIKAAAEARLEEYEDEWFSLGIFTKE